VTGVERLGKRLVIALEGELFVVLHLMIAGRLRWQPPGAKVPGKLGLAAFDFSSGTLVLTEASTQKRAALHVVAGRTALAAHDPGGLEVADVNLCAFRTALLRENHTLKRALTDARIFSGIGNAYSDEILHRARLSPVRLTRQLGEDEIARLHTAAPEHVTAFREGMAVHGRYRQPCPVCGTPVQRIVHGDRETNYCPTCQTGGTVLADRSLSRLLKDDWPRRVEELETPNRR